jgi:hypothetical protein
MFCDSMVIEMVFAAHIIVAKSHSNSECEPSQMCICTYCILKKEFECFSHECALFEQTIYCFRGQQYGIYMRVYDSV